MQLSPKWPLNDKFPPDDAVLLCGCPRCVYVGRCGGMSLVVCDGRNFHIYPDGGCDSVSTAFFDKDNCLVSDKWTTALCECVRRGVAVGLVRGSDAAAAGKRIAEWERDR